MSLDMIAPGIRLLSIVLLALGLSACDGASADPDEQEQAPFPTAAEVIAAMGDGFNLGNVFENGGNPPTFAASQPVIAAYLRVGMTHVRMPITWMDGFGGDHLADANGRVNFSHSRFRELKRTIDHALDRGLYVIINAHHEHAFKYNYDGSAAFDTRFTNLWTDIATYFADYDHHLVFEVLNEPEGAFGSWGGDVHPNDPVGIALTRQIAQVGVDAIRATGGNNAERTILVGLNAHGNHQQIDEVFPTRAELPGGGSDNYLALEVHTYDPWDFCGQDGSNSNFPGVAAIESGIRSVAAHARTLGIPLHYGEFGVGRNGRQSDRDTELVRSFYRTVVQTARDEGASHSAWDDRGWFGLVTGNEQSGYEFVYDIVPSMLAE